MVYSDSDGSAQGFFVTILNTIAQKENWNVQYVPGTWQEGLDRLKSDQIDLLLCTGYTEERDKYLDFSKEFLLLDWGTIYKAKGSSINNIFDLEGKTVSIVKGSVLTAGFQELINQFQIHVTMKEMDQVNKVFSSVVSGSADAGVAANLSGILDKDWQKVERTPIIFTPSKLGFAVNEGKNGDLISVLDREISALKADKSSVYYHELENMLGNKKQEIPKEAYWVLCGVVAALLLAISWTIILKRQIRAKTEHLEAEIVERKRTEEMRSNEKAFLRSLIDSADDLIYFKDSNGIYIGCNKASEKFIGLSEEEQMGKSDFDLLDHELAEQVQKHDKLAMESNTAVRFEEWVTRSDGSRVLLDTIKAPIVTPDRQVLGLVGFSRDITDRKQIEKALLEREFELEEAQLLAHTGSWTYDPVTQKSTWSKGMFLIWGLDPSIGLFPVADHQKYIHPDDYPRFAAVLKEALENGVPYKEELRINRPDGTERTIITICEPLCDSTGKVVKLRGSNQDITERKQVEKTLSQQKALFEAIFTCIPDAIVYTNVDRNVVGINPAFSSIFGFTIDDLKGEKTSFFYESMEEYERQGRIRFNLTASEHALPYEVNYRKKDGSTFPGETLGTIITDGSDMILGYIGVIRDITARKQALEEKHLFEQQMQHTQKLESLGVLSGGIAHDFNNILAIIKGNCSLATMDSENTENYINEIDKASDRAAALCRQMLAYAGKAQLSMAQVNMWMLVDEMTAMLKSTLPQNAVIIPELQTNIPFITADASQIRQIVMNLIINASEAIGKEQGEVKVSLTTTTVIAGQAEKDYHGKAIPQGVYVCLEVTDTGCGMDEETKWRIFEPFYTTKFTGRGLGMSAVLGIINSHKGAVQLFSQLGQGTTFKVYLPVQASNSTGEEDQNQSVPSVPWQGSGTILLVEDEKQLMFLAKSMLEMFGFTVLEAANGREALELYQKNAEEVTLVMTDMGMPVMDGYELIPALKQFNPKLPIIVSSGFGDADVNSRIGSDNIAGIISKPYNPNQLREVLKGVVEGIQKQT